ncbi:MAG: fluoride efflux transporter CrcB [Clostridiales bacterium]|nr:fluoride efflux transporter CrcB [Clostridiales bacterium]
MIKAFIAIFLGGGIGSVLRYAIQVLLHERIVPYNFPWSTFMVNIIGSFLIGLLYTISAKFNVSDEVRLFLTAGLCGGFTTFSTFSNDTLLMIRHGDGLPCLIYVAASVILGIIACYCGSVAIKSPFLIE